MDAPRSTQHSAREIWLCFFNFRWRNTHHAVRSTNCHKLLSIMILRRFARQANWLCFFNFVSAIRITHHAIRESWLCFFNLSSIFRRFLLFFTCFLHYFGIFFFDFTQDKHNTYELTADFDDYAETIINSSPHEIGEAAISRGK